MVSQDGTLTYRARPDGSPYSVINQARGSYTELPESGDKVGCGGVLYRVDDKPVLLLCGTVPAYRALHVGDAGPGRPSAQPQPARARCRRAPSPRRRRRRSRRSSAARALDVTGALALGDAVFLPEAVRIAKVTGQLGGSARPGAPVAERHLRHAARAGEPRSVAAGRGQAGRPRADHAAGQHDGDGKGRRVRTQSPRPRPDRTATPADATIPTYISLDDPAKARGLDKAPVQVDITTKGVDDALSVPVTALVGKSGGGFAVEVVRAGGRRELVAVKLGLFDTADGRVQVEGDLREGDRVVVPSL